MLVIKAAVVGAEEEEGVAAEEAAEKIMASAHSVSAWIAWKRSPPAASVLEI